MLSVRLFYSQKGPLLNKASRISQSTCTKLKLWETKKNMHAFVCGEDRNVISSKTTQQMCVGVYVCVCACVCVCVCERERERGVYVGRERVKSSQSFICF